MRRFLTYLSLVSLAISCCRMETVPDNGPDEVMMEFFISSSELVMDGPESKATSPLDPGIENTIANLWLLQYAGDGRLVKAEYQPLDYPVMSISLQARFVKSSGSTVVLIANMGGVGTDDAEWPSSGDFKWGEHGGASLYDLQNKLFSCSLESYDRRHLFMIGVTQLDVDDASALIPVNVMLSRLACKFRVSIKSSSEDVYSNVRLKLVNCPVRMGLFPKTFTFSAEDLAEYACQEVCGADASLRTDAYDTFYFYANENQSSDPDLQTGLVIMADKNGQAVSRTLPVSSQGTTFRNTCYDIHINLK